MITNRKESHLSICSSVEVQAGHSYWDDLLFTHQSIPSFDFEEIDLSTEVFGKHLNAPFVISGMTGGCDTGKRVNRNLAVAAEKLAIGMGVGSQRAALERPDLADSYSIVQEYDIPLVYGNIGAPQLISQHDSRDPVNVEAGIDVMKMVGADLLAVHMNYLQEMVMPEGDIRSRGVIEALTELASELPILAKETGAGISNSTAMLLRNAGVRGFDVGGAGGTSFAAVEAYRAGKAGYTRKERLGRTFMNWGIPTPVSIREAQVGLPVIATGGLRSGLDLARAIILGAGAGGFAYQLLLPALDSPEAVVQEIEIILDELKVAMFLSGARTIGELRNVRLIETGNIKDWRAKE